jgi:quercetin dioxygenase-like cupin family protein
MDSDFLKLKQMTEGLKNWDFSTTPCACEKNGGGDSKPYLQTCSVNVEIGKAIQSLILREGTVHVSKVMIEKGTVYPSHDHKYWQYLIVYSGKIKILITHNTFKPEHTLGKYGVVYFKPYQTHCALAIEDTEGILITIPSDDDTVQ